jgi:hypothetical protein
MASVPTPLPPTGDEPVPGVIESVTAALAPGRFFVSGGLDLIWEHTPAEDTAWEIFRGRLLDPAHTRQRRTFAAWNAYLVERGERSVEPLLSVKLDPAENCLYVVRGILCYAWEGYHAGENVYLSRETRKWVRELVGRVELADFSDALDLAKELAAVVFDAVVGTNRLPLTSVEAPLPAFSLGQLLYVPGPGRPADPGPMRSVQQLLANGLRHDLTWRQKAKLLECLLRTVPAEGVREVAGHLTARWQAIGHSRADLGRLFRTLFNEVALSPYTGFVDTCLACWKALVAAGCFRVEDFVDFLAWLQRQLGRHLTAYDLVTFHHRGANYPDALLLDAVLNETCQLVERHPDLWLAHPQDPPERLRAKRLRRRGLRQAWLHRRACEGLPVPDVPVSPGENLRVLPPPHARVPEEQLLNPARRTKRLFVDEPLVLGPCVREALRQGVRDLEHTEELRELGLAVFLERPLGTAKLPGEPDQTPLLAHEAFSVSIARRRLRALHAEPESAVEPDRWPRLLQALEDLPPGVRLPLPFPPERPGSVSAYDSRKAADDFLFLRTLSGSVRTFFDLFDLGQLAGQVDTEYLQPGRRLLILAEPMPGLVAVYDAQGRKRLQLRTADEQGFRRRQGVELPVAGMEVVVSWDETPETGELRERRWPAGALRLRLREHG